MNRFEVVGYRSDERYFYVDVSYKDSARNVKALESVLTIFAKATGLKKAWLGTHDAQRHALSRVLSEMLQFSDQDAFAGTSSDAARQKKLRLLAKSVTAHMAMIVTNQRGRKVMALSFTKPGDETAFLRTLRKNLSA